MKKSELKVEQVAARVDNIKAVTADYEHAHYLEMELWRDVLKAIAGGSEIPQDLAKTALRTTRIKFGRHYA